jgi:UDP-N-acetylmuramate: L-alanyl-gamma-D-glutamyl-meso-diaminopimelate ligase
MRIHFIAIGGSAMHNLAIALKQKGYAITGSDDEIFEPSRSRLAQNELLPQEIGWFPEKITSELDAIVLGMHARKDNPELIKAKELGIKIFSYPEYLYEETKNKMRIVVGGSHGKTTITAMIMHVLKDSGIAFDYMVGAHIAGFENMVGLSNSTKIAVFEGDEYLTSPIDPRPKFHLYKPHVAVISGIAWDHINVFPTKEFYEKQFELFVKTIQPKGHLVFAQNDKSALKVSKKAGIDTTLLPYTEHPNEVKNNATYLKNSDEFVKIKVFGKHNLENISAALNVCKIVGITESKFYKSIASFSGAAKRMQKLASNETVDVFTDFAHAPSKVRATVKALKEAYPNRKLVACLELHTFSSLNKSFLDEYSGTLNEADFPLVFYTPSTIEHKKLPPLDPNFVKQKFGNASVKVFNNPKELYQHILKHPWYNTNLLFMSSGNFGGLDLNRVANVIVEDDDFPKRYLKF